MIKYTKGELLDAIQGFHSTTGRVPKLTEVGKQHAYVNHFGSWNNALKLAGFEPRNRALNIPGMKTLKEDRIERIKRFDKILGRVPTNQDFYSIGTLRRKTLRRYFGSVRNAYIAAGINYPLRKWYLAEIISLLQIALYNAQKSVSYLKKFL